jgi:hypothetical protein
MSKRLREWRLSRARATRAEKPAAPPDPGETFAKEAHDLDAIRKSVEDAAAVSAGFWLSYLFVLFYIGIAAGAVTHKDLLLENPVKLPFLNVELPLVAFFFLAPILFIVSHAYTLVHFVMLAAKVGVFDTELRARLGDAPETRESLRRQLPSNIFVQLLAGPEDIRKSGLGLILKVIAWISLVIDPVLLLLLIQAQFLPYHLWWVIWVQRVVIVVDVTLLWLLWPAVLNGRSKLMWRLERRRPGWLGVLTLTGRYVGGIAACMIPIWFAFTAATFPGEWLDKRVRISTSFRDLLFNGEVDGVTRRRKSLFSNTLVLPGFDALEAAKIDDQKKLDSVNHAWSLRGRHLEQAAFDEADLRKVDLTGAYLEGARFDYARLERASLGDQTLSDQTLLVGAHLRYARLQGAILVNTQLQGAELSNAQLQGVLLNAANLQGATLEEAQFQGATLFFPHLQGSVLNSANLQGAKLSDAELQGASLAFAQLQGTEFQRSAFTGTTIDQAEVWRMNVDFEIAPSDTAVFWSGLEESGLPKTQIVALKADIMKDMPEGTFREEALKRIEVLNPDILGPEANQTQALEKRRVTEAAYQRALADQLKSLACSGDEYAPYVVRGLIANERIKDTGAEAPGLVAAILDSKCPVSAALTDADKAALNRIAREASGAP